MCKWPSSADTPTYYCKFMYFHIVLIVIVLICLFYSILLFSCLLICRRNPHQVLRILPLHQTLRILPLRYVVYMMILVFGIVFRISLELMTHYLFVSYSCSYIIGTNHNIFNGGREYSYYHHRVGWWCRSTR